MQSRVQNIPSEIKSSIYLGLGLFLTDLAFILIYTFFIMDTFSFLVFDSLKVFYLLFNILVSILLTRSIGHKNPQKKVYERIIIVLLSMRNQNYIYKEPTKKGEIHYVEN